MMPQQYKSPRSQFADLRRISRYPCRHAGQCVSSRSILLDPIYVRSDHGHWKADSHVFVVISMPVIFWPMRNRTCKFTLVSKTLVFQK